MSKTDFHIHAEYSYDSKILAEEIVQTAISLSYESIAITEHLDLLPQELGYFGLKSLSQYVFHLTALKARYPQIRLLCGLEIGDYHQVRDFARPLISQFEFDLILGSVHFLSDKTNVAIPIKRPLSPADLEDYYRQNLELVSTCEIDVLAHLGVYKRFLSEKPDERRLRPLLKEILEVLIDRKIALEINFSSFRKTYQSLLPEPEVLELYHHLGGRLISIGSDAHKLEHFDDNYSQVLPYLAQFTVI